MTLSKRTKNFRQHRNHYAEFCCFYSNDLSDLRNQQQNIRPKRDINGLNFFYYEKFPESESVAEKYTEEKNF